MKTRIRTFSGGYSFKKFDGQPQARIVSDEIPQRVVIPLKQGFGEELTARVKPGDPVQAGQIVARDDETICSPIHSSVNGAVETIEDIDVDGRKSQALIIESDGSSEWQRLEGSTTDWRSLSEAEIEELLYLSGVTALGSCGIPTGFKSSVIMPEEVEHVIVQHTEADVFNHCLDTLWEDERFEQFLDALQIIRKIYPGAAFHLALSASQQDWWRRIEAALADQEGIGLCAVKPKYPQSFDEVLIPTILGKDIPGGYSAANIGVVVLDFLLVQQVYEAVALGKPLIDRMITLCGPCFKENFHLNVRIGTPVEATVTGRMREHSVSRFLWNSALTGDAIGDLSVPITRDRTSIIALVDGSSEEFFPFARPGFKRDSYSNTFLSKILPFKKESDTNIHGEKRACLSCEFCSDVCPAGIFPQLLHRYVERDIIDEGLIQYGIFDCIECNLCSYVCPSKIAIARFIREGKERLKQEGFDTAGNNTAGYELKGLNGQQVIE